MPIEAINAFKLLWNYYFSHIVLLTMLSFFFCFIVPDKVIWISGIFLTGLVLWVELIQWWYPFFGDACIMDIVFGLLSIAISYFLFLSIRFRSLLLKGE